MVEWGIAAEHGLADCRARGLTWGGLYGIFDRVSCWCCPLGGIAQAEKLYHHFPAFWQRMLEMESWLPEPYRQYAGKHSVSDLDQRFSGEAARRPRQPPQHAA